MSLDRERTPKLGTGWEPMPLPAFLQEGEASAWRRGRLVVISTLADITTNGVDGPCWLLSLSRAGNRRPDDKDLKRMLRDFAVPSPWDEDNHEPGRARKVFVPVNPAQRTACECKTDETIVVEPDGYRWSKPKEEP